MSSPRPTSARPTSAINPVPDPGPVKASELDGAETTPGRAATAGAGAVVPPDDPVNGSIPPVMGGADDGDGPVVVAPPPPGAPVIVDAVDVGSDAVVVCSDVVGVVSDTGPAGGVDVPGCGGVVTVPGAVVVVVGPPTGGVVDVAAELVAMTGAMGDATGREEVIPVGTVSFGYEVHVRLRLLPDTTKVSDTDESSVRVTVSD